MGIILGLALGVGGFFAGFGIATLLWLSISNAEQKKTEKRSEERHDIVKLIGASTAVIENSFSAYRVGNMDYDVLKQILMKKIDEINTVINSNIDILDSFYVKNMERFISDQKGFLIRKRETSPSLTTDEKVARIVSRVSTPEVEKIFPKKQDEPAEELVFEEKDAQESDEETDTDIVQQPVKAPVEETGSMDEDHTDSEEAVPEVDVFELEEPQQSKQQTPVIKEELPAFDGVMMTEKTFELETPATEQQQAGLAVDDFQEPLTPEIIEQTVEIEKPNFAKNKSHDIKSESVQEKVEESDDLTTDSDEEKDTQQDYQDQAMASFEMGATTRIPLDSFKKFQQDGTMESAEQDGSTISDMSIDEQMPTQIYDFGDTMPPKTTVAESFDKPEGEDTGSVFNLEDIGNASSAPVMPQLFGNKEDLPVKGQPVFESSLDIDATQEFNVRDLLEKAKKVPGQVPSDVESKQKKPFATVSDQGNEDVFEVEMKPKKPKKKPTGGDSLITGNDVIDQMDNFFGFE